MEIFKSPIFMPHPVHPPNPVHPVKKNFVGSVAASGGVWERGLTMLFPENRNSVDQCRQAASRFIAEHRERLAANRHEPAHRIP